MKFRKIFIFIVLLLMCPELYAEGDSRIGGVYEIVAGKSMQFDGEQVDIVEFLSFYCGHCYQFEKSMPVIKGNFPGKIRWKTVPIHWGNGSPKPGEAYFLAEEAGKGEQMKAALFHAFFVKNRDIGSIEVLEDIAMKLGLGFDFSRKLREGEKAKNVGEAIILATTFGINETPSLIIAGNMKTNPGMLQGNIDNLRDNVIIMLKSIFKK